MHDGEEMYLHGHNETAVINSLEEEAKSKGWDEDELFLPKLRAYIKGYYEKWECIDAAQLGFNGDMELLGTELSSREEWMQFGETLQMIALF